MRAQAELFYNSQVPASYGVAAAACTGVDGSIFTEATGLQALLVGLAAPVCNSTTTTWAVSQELSTAGSFFCADSTGVAEVGTKVSDATGLCVAPIVP